MKIAILSDTHGNYSLAVRELEQLPDLDCIIHLGDTLEDAEIIECALDCPTIKVAGNCDTEPGIPRELLLSMSDTMVFATHGDQFGVKSGISRLKHKASILNAGVVLYGHTHLPIIHEEDSILFINPGCLKKTASSLSFAVLTINNGQFSAEIVQVTGMCVQAASL